jgi:excisionase family DNA binding protein
MDKLEFLTPSQIAERLQIVERTVYRWLDAGELKGIKLGRVWRVRIQDFEDFLRARENSKDKTNE